MTVGAVVLRVAWQLEAAVAAQAAPSETQNNTRDGNGSMASPGGGLFSSMAQRQWSPQVQKPYASRPQRSLQTQFAATPSPPPGKPATAPPKRRKRAKPRNDGPPDWSA